MSSRAAIPLVAAVTFLAGFGLAELTGVRAIGGLVLFAGGAWCGRLAVPTLGWRSALVLLAIALGLFVLSHPLGNAIGAWPAVVVAAALVAGVAVVVGWGSRARVRSSTGASGAS